MAKRPVTITSAKGIDNRHAPETLVEYDKNIAESFLTEAINVDITRGGRVVRRNGFTLQSAGICHSLWWGGDTGFVVKDSRFGLIDASLNFTDLLAASDRPVSYADTGGGIYMSDNQFIGRYVNGAFEVLAKAGTYSPVSTAQMDPTEDPVLYDYPPPGNLLVWMFARLWSVTDDVVFYSRGYLPDQCNLADDYIDEPGVTLLAPVSDGYYIGTQDRVQFVSSPNPKVPAPVKVVSEVGAVKGTQVITDARFFKLAGAIGPAVVWESSEGKVLGLSGGQVIKMTYDNVVYPVGDSGASFLRELNGEVHHISSITSGDSDTSNMRTTDVAVAEVIRNGIPV